MMKHCYPEGSGLFQDDSAPNHTALGLTEWFDKDETYGKSHAYDLNLTEH